jgi:hypothetical protein
MKHHDGVGRWRQGDLFYVHVAPARYAAVGRWIRWRSGLIPKTKVARTVSKAVRAGAPRGADPPMQPRMHSDTGAERMHLRIGTRSVRNPCAESA